MNCLTITVNFEELRNWVSFAFLIIGGTIAIRAFILNQRQRKLENSFRLIELCKNSLSDNDRLSWHQIFIASSEPAGAKPGHFVDENKVQIPFSQLFSEGEFIAQGAIERYCELFDLIGYEYLRGTVDIRPFYFEFGQYLVSIHYWVSSIDDGRFIKSHYPYFYELFETNKAKFHKLPHKTVGKVD